MQKTQVWNKEGVVPHGIDVMELQGSICVVSLPLWSKASGLWAHLWATQDYVRVQLTSLSVVHQLLHEVPDLQCAWMLLLYCCAARAGKNHFHQKKKNTFIKKTRSSKKHVHQKTRSSKKHSTSLGAKKYGPYFCESVASRRLATLSQTRLMPVFRVSTSLHMKVCSRPNGGNLGV